MSRQSPLGRQVDDAVEKVMGPLYRRGELDRNDAEHIHDIIFGGLTCEYNIDSRPVACDRAFRL